MDKIYTLITHKSEDRATTAHHSNKLKLLYEVSIATAKYYGYSGEVKDLSSNTIDLIQKNDKKAMEYYQDLLSDLGDHAYTLTSKRNAQHSYFPGFELFEVDTKTFKQKLILDI